MSALNFGSPVDRTRRGYALNELLLAVAAVGLIIGIAGTGYRALKRSTQADEVSMKFVQLANDIRKYWRTLGSFSTLSAPGLYKMGIVQKPFYINSAILVDPWGNMVFMAGADTYFAVLLGGNGVIAPEECTALATSVADTAYEVRVGSAVVLGTGAAVGRTSGGYAFKTGGSTMDGGALQTGCAEVGAKIGFSFDG